MIAEVVQALDRALCWLHEAEHIAREPVVLEILNEIAVAIEDAEAELETV